MQEKSNLASYCPISLLSIISKPLEDIIKQHLLSNNLLTDVQFGFRYGYSAPDRITALVRGGMITGDCTIAAPLMDFSHTEANHVQMREALDNAM
eukprot:g27552.t1